MPQIIIFIQIYKLYIFFKLRLVRFRKYLFSIDVYSQLSLLTVHLESFIPYSAQCYLFHFDARFIF